jgi:hypothetical protein
MESLGMTMRRDALLSFGRRQSIVVFVFVVVALAVAVAVALAVVRTTQRGPAKRGRTT